MSGYTSYLSNILTNTTSRYNSLRKILLNNEDDGDTEDDSHISRVLRAYYKEKGRPFPPWLPPDPNDRRAITPQPDTQAGGGYFGMRNPYASNVQQQSGLPSSNRGSLNDLWDSPAVPSQQPTSLRAGRRAPGTRAEPQQSSLAPPQARPLPSQRAGSHQNVQSAPPPISFHRGGFAADPNPSPSGGTAQERLKAKLWGRGAGSSSSLSTSSTGNVYDQQPSANPYDTGGSGGGSSSTSRRFGRIQ